MTHSHLFALGPEPVSRAVLNLSSYLHGQRAEWMRLHKKYHRKHRQKYYCCSIWDFLTQQIEWEGLSFSCLRGGGKPIYFPSITGNPRMSKWKRSPFPIFNHSIAHQMLFEHLLCFRNCWVSRLKGECGMILINMKLLV